jgi:hypothetical protein
MKLQTTAKKPKFKGVSPLKIKKAEGENPSAFFIL